MTTPSPSPFDLHMMDIALAMARRGLGRTAPNPAVGAVIADETTGEIVARGWTQPGGRPHAETEAIRRAGDRARGKTIYVTLEPCSHYGKTPPCADAIGAAGLARVVTAIEDPDPRVAGRGLDRLRAAGLHVMRGVRAAEARWVTRGHIVRVTERRPLVSLKIAAAADGAVPPGGQGQPKWVTGPEARAVGHRLRAEADAILVGRGTLRDDDPELTCRLPGLADRSPTRVVLSRAVDLPGNGRLLATAAAAPIWLFADGDRLGDATRAAKDIVAGSTPADAVKLSRVPSVGGRLWLPAVMEELVAEGITRLLVEGGPRIWRAFADLHLVDAVHLFQAGRPDERAARATLAARLGPLPLELASARPVGPDTHFEFHAPAIRSSPPLSPFSTPLGT